MTMFTEGDTVIITKGSAVLKIEPGVVGRVISIKCAQGSQLIPGQDKVTYPVQFVYVDIGGKQYLFGPVDNPLAKASATVATADRDRLLIELAAANQLMEQYRASFVERTAMVNNEHAALLAERKAHAERIVSIVVRWQSRSWRLVQHALRYRREWKKARAELVELSAALSSKELEIQEMRAAKQLATDITASVEKAAGVSEGLVGRLELKVKSLEADLQRAQQDRDAIALTAKRPQVAAETLLRQFGYTGDLLDMIKAQQHDREVAQKAFTSAVAAESEPGKIIEFPATEQVEQKPA